MVQLSKERAKDSSNNRKRRNVVAFLVLLICCAISVGLLLNPHPAHADVTSNLVGHYTMDTADDVNNIADTSGSGNNGILHLGSGGSTSTTTVPGAIKQGLSFDHVDDYVDMGTGLNPDAFTGLTLSAWVKTTNNTLINQAIITKASGAFNNIYFTLGANSGEPGQPCFL